MCAVLIPSFARSEEAAHHHAPQPSVGVGTLPGDTSSSGTPASTRATITGEIVDATMSGNRHIELVTTADNQIRIYVLDEFLKPLSVAGIRGTALVRNRAPAERRSALVVNRGGSFLRATDTTREADDEDVTVTLDTPDGPLTMTLPFPEPNGTARMEEQPSAVGHHHH
jgi:hypothetical protein